MNMRIAIVMRVIIIFKLGIDYTLLYFDFYFDLMRIKYSLRVDMQLIGAQVYLIVW